MYGPPWCLWTDLQQREGIYAGLGEDIGTGANWKLSGELRTMRHGIDYRSASLPGNRRRLNAESHTSIAWLHSARAILTSCHQHSINTCRSNTRVHKMNILSVDINWDRYHGLKKTSWYSGVRGFVWRAST